MDRIPADAMVVVADGESARVFRNVGTDGALSLHQQALSLMRPQLHKETLRRMHGELAKTLTNAPVEDVVRALS